MDSQKGFPKAEKLVHLMVWWSGSRSAFLLGQQLVKMLEKWLVMRLVELLEGE